MKTTIEREREAHVGPRRKVGYSMARKPERPRVYKGPRTMADIERMLRFLFSK